MALNLYDRYLMPRLIDACCGLPAIQAHRARLLPLARGAVLEIGIGTGRNLPFYDGTRITTLHGLDPAPPGIWILNTNPHVVRGTLK